MFQVLKRFEERNLRDLKQQKQTSLFPPHRPCQCSAKDGLVIDHKAWGDRAKAEVTETVEARNNGDEATDRTSVGSRDVPFPYFSVTSPFRL